MMASTMATMTAMATGPAAPTSLPVTTTPGPAQGAPGAVARAGGPAGKGVRKAPSFKAALDEVGRGPSARGLRSGEPAGRVGDRATIGGDGTTAGAADADDREEEIAGSRERSTGADPGATDGLALVSDPSASLLEGAPSALTAGEWAAGGANVAGQGAAAAQVAAATQIAAAGQVAAAGQGAWNAVPDAALAAGAVGSATGGYGSARGLGPEAGSGAVLLAGDLADGPGSDGPSGLPGGNPGESVLAPASQPVGAALTGAEAGQIPGTGRSSAFGETLAPGMGADSRDEFRGGGEVSDNFGTATRSAQGPGSGAAVAARVPAEDVVPGARSGRVGGLPGLPAEDGSSAAVWEAGDLATPAGARKPNAADGEGSRMETNIGTPAPAAPATRGATVIATGGRATGASEADALGGIPGGPLPPKVTRTSAPGSNGPVLTGAGGAGSGAGLGADLAAGTADSGGHLVAGWEATEGPERASRVAVQEVSAFQASTQGSAATTALASATPATLDAGAAGATANGSGEGSVDSEQTPRPVMDQVIRSAQLLSRGGLGEMRVRLDPPGLGEIVLRLRASSGEVWASAVASPETAQALRAGTAELGRILESRGLTLAGFTVREDAGRDLAVGSTSNTGGNAAYGTLGGGLNGGAYDRYPGHHAAEAYGPWYREPVAGLDRTAGASLARGRGMLAALSAGRRLDRVV
jgi:hypothetical protein